MLKTLIVLLVGAMAVGAGKPVSFNAGPSAVYLGESNYEAPLNCQASQAASKPSIGKKMCQSLMEATKFAESDEDLEQDLLFECACALATHNIWYKAIASKRIRRTSRLADRMIVDRLAGLAKSVDLAEVSINNFNDRLDYLKDRNAYEWTELIKSIQRKLVEIYNPYTKDEDKGYNAFKRMPERGRQVAVDICNELAQSKRWSGLIKPSLEALEASSYGGSYLRYALVQNQPELDQLVGLENLCQSLTTKVAVE